MYLVEQRTCSWTSSSALAELSVTLDLHGAWHMTQQASELLVYKQENMAASCELLRETDEKKPAGTDLLQIVLSNTEARV